MKCEYCGGIEELYCTQCNRKCGSRTKDGGCCDAICKSCNGTGKQPEEKVLKPKAIMLGKLYSGKYTEMTVGDFLDMCTEQE